MKKLVAVFLLIALMLSCVACGASEPAAPAAPAETEKAPAAEVQTEPAEVVYEKPEITLVLSDINNETTIWGKTAQLFADLVAERSKGKIEIKLFCGGQLGSEEDNVNNLRNGTVDITVLNVANLETRGVNVPEFTLFGLPYLVRSPEHGTRFFNSEDGIALADRIAEATNGEIVSMYSYVSSTPKHFFSKEYRENLADYAGLKMRSATSEISIDMIEAFGMTASPMGLNDVYSALQTGMIDGTEHNLSNIYNYAFYEICPYIILTHQTYNQNAYIMSGSAAEKLGEDKQLVIECMQEACAWCNATYTAEDEEMAKKLTDLGVTFIEPANIQEWYDAAQPLYDKYAEGYDEFIATVLSYE